MGHKKRMIELLHSDLWKLSVAVVTIFPDNHHIRMTEYTEPERLCLLFTPIIAITAVGSCCPKGIQDVPS